MSARSLGGVLLAALVGGLVGGALTATLLTDGAAIGGAAGSPDRIAVVAALRASVVTVHPIGPMQIHGLSGETFDVSAATGAGSGLIVSADGFILTNRHVASGAERITVTLDDGRSFPARIVRLSDVADLALLRIDADGLVPARLRTDPAARVGESVLAIGTPLGSYPTSASSGIVSGTGRTMEIPLDRGGSLVRLTELIQTDAAISVGSSGGPLVDAQGKVIGIITSLNRSGEELSFATPIGAATELLALLAH